MASENAQLPLKFGKFHEIKNYEIYQISMAYYFLIMI